MGVFSNITAAWKGCVVVDGRSVHMTHTWYHITRDSSSGHSLSMASAPVQSSAEDSPQPAASRHVPPGQINICSGTCELKRSASARPDPSLTEAAAAHVRTRYIRQKSREIRYASHSPSHCAGRRCNIDRSAHLRQGASQASGARGSSLLGGSLGAGPPGPSEAM